MRRVCSTAAVAITLLFIGSSIALGQGGGAGLTITNYQLLGEVRSTRTEWFVTYRANLVNAGPARGGVTATVTSMVPEVQVVPGQVGPPLHPGPGQQHRYQRRHIHDTGRPFRPVRYCELILVVSESAGKSRPEPDRQGRRAGQPERRRIIESERRWNTDSTAGCWNLARPRLKRRSLNAGTVTPSFVVDAAGAYVISLTVDNGSATDKATVIVNTGNSPPSLTRA